jgi:hypothetical protein
MPKFIVYETKANGKDYRLATCDSLAAALKEQKRRRKLVNPESVVGVQEKSMYEFIKSVQLKERDKNGN